MTDTRTYASNERYLGCFKNITQLRYDTSLSSSLLFAGVGAIATGHKANTKEVLVTDENLSTNGGGGTDKLTKIRNGQRQALMPLGSVNPEVVIELVDEKPTDEMMSGLKRFWEKVFAELLPSEEGSCQSEGDELDDQKIIIEFDCTRRTSRTTSTKRA